MPSMTREQLRQRPQELGETPPLSWKRTQLEARISEIMSEQEPSQEKITKKMLTSELNKAARKKSDLKHHVQDILQVQVVGNETIPQLVSKGPALGRYGAEGRDQAQSPSVPKHRSSDEQPCRTSPEQWRMVRHNGILVQHPDRHRDDGGREDEEARGRAEGASSPTSSRVQGSQDACGADYQKDKKGKTTSQ